MPEWLAILILGVIEGITEFLPVSSTGHLLLAEQWLPRQSDLFNIVIQTAAVLAVLPLFKDRLLSFFTRFQDPDTRDYALKIALSFLITAALGFILDKKGFKLPEKAAPVGMALLIGGIGFLIAEQFISGRPRRPGITWCIAIAVGLGQVVAAVFPGASRSGTTIIIMLLMGLGRAEATEFTFLVSIPTMLAAGGWKILKALRHAPGTATAPEHWNMVLLGSIVSAIVSFIAVRWLLRFVQTHTFKGFGWYRIAAGLLVLITGR